MIKRNIFKIFLSLLVLFTFFSCEENYTPKPRGYFRISFPEKQYQTFSNEFPYSFEYPTYSKIEIYNKDSCWINISFPNYNAKIHITYRKVTNNLPDLIEQSRKFSYKHTSKADEIIEELKIDKKRKVFGTQYEIKGNVASSVQFYLTDSVKNFMRASLYFSEIPNQDSLAPVLSFIKKDINRFIETFEWTEQK